MDPLAILTDPLAYGFMQRGLLAAVLVGVVCAVMGSFVVLKGLAFIGDAISHAAFPGLVVAYLLGWPLYLGGAVAAVATALAIGAVSRRGQLRFDTSVGVLFAGTFALGVGRGGIGHGRGSFPLDRNGRNECYSAKQRFAA